MEHLIKLFDRVPKWFAYLALAMVLALLGLVTYSSFRTILFDCGTIRLSGSGPEFGGHCQLQPVSQWRAVSIPDGPLAEDSLTQPGLTRRQAICESAVSRAMEKWDERIHSQGKSWVAPDGAQSGAASGILMLWYKVEYLHKIDDETEMRVRWADILFQCQPDDALIVATGAGSLPILEIADQAKTLLTTELNRN